MRMSEKEKAPELRDYREGERVEITRYASNLDGLQGEVISGPRHDIPGWGNDVYGVVVPGYATPLFLHAKHLQPAKASCCPTCGQEMRS